MPQLFAQLGMVQPPCSRRTPGWRVAVSRCWHQTWWRWYRDVFVIFAWCSKPSTTPHESRTYLAPWPSRSWCITFSCGDVSRSLPRLHFLAMVSLRFLLHELCIFGSFLVPDCTEWCKGNLESHSPKGVQVLSLACDPRPGLDCRASTAARLG
jgi:hypothetical protein